MAAHGTQDIGMIGLGVMGMNFALNLDDHGFAVAGYDRDPAKLKALRDQSAGRKLLGADDLPSFMDLLKSPRVIMILIPAGPPVDAVIRDLLPHLQPGDIVMDGGNSHFTDTNVRHKALQDQGVDFFGVGVSGGEEGARHGPCLMPGGPRQAYDQIRPMLEATAARVDDEPCVAYLGPASAGHYVKMIHNGIEYAVMQLIAETYDLMKRGLGLNDDELHEVYADWNQREPAGYLLEITANIFLKQDEQTGQRLIDVIRDVAAQKGTGMWASQDGMELHAPIPMIDTAVEMRDLSAFYDARSQASALYGGPPQSLEVNREEFIVTLRQALYAGMLMAFANGLDCLRKASRTYDYGIDMAQVARIWRGGCIIRARLLDKVRQAYVDQPDLSSLLLARGIVDELSGRRQALEDVSVAAARHGLPTAGFMTALYTYDAFRSAWLPDNLIQAQRDYFGAHTYERTDRKGVFHTVWGQAEPPVGAGELSRETARRRG